MTHIKSIQLKTIGISLLTLAMTYPAWAKADVYVITHTGTSVTAEDVKDIFLGEKQLAGSTKITPIDNSAAQAEFLQKAIGMDTAKYNTTWTKKSFRDGLNPPAVKSSDLEVVEFVKKTEGAVGYTSTPPEGVTVVTKL